MAKTHFVLNKASEAAIKIPPHSGKFKGVDEVDNLDEAVETSSTPMSNTDDSVDVAQLRKTIEAEVVAEFQEKVEDDINTLHSLYQAHITKECDAKVTEAMSMMKAQFEKILKQIDKGAGVTAKMQYDAAYKAVESHFVKLYDDSLTEIDDALANVKSTESLDGTGNTPVGGGSYGSKEEFDAAVSEQVKVELEGIKADVDNILQAVDDKLQANTVGDVTSVDDDTALAVDSAATVDSEFDTTPTTNDDDAELKATESAIHFVSRMFGPVVGRRLKLAFNRKKKYPLVDSEKFRYVKVGESNYLKFNKEGLTFKATEEEALELDAMTAENDAAGAVDDVEATINEAIEKGDALTKEDVINVLEVVRDAYAPTAGIVNDTADSEAMGEFNEIDEENIMADDSMIEEGDLPPEDEFSGVELDAVDEEMLNDMDGLDSQGVESVMGSIAKGHIKDIDGLKRYIHTLRYYNGYDFKKASESAKMKKELVKQQYTNEAMKAYFGGKKQFKTVTPEQKLGFDPYNFQDYI